MPAEFVPLLGGIPVRAARRGRSYRPARANRQAHPTSCHLDADPLRVSGIIADLGGVAGRRHASQSSIRQVQVTYEAHGLWR